MARTSSGLSPPGRSAGIRQARRWSRSLPDRHRGRAALPSPNFEGDAGAVAGWAGFPRRFWDAGLQTGIAAGRETPIANQRTSAGTRNRRSSDRHEGEVRLVAVSEGKRASEEALLGRHRERYETALRHLHEGLTIPHRRKRYEKVMDTVGRLRERYRQVSAQYEVDQGCANSHRQPKNKRGDQETPVFRPASRAQAANLPSLTRKKRGDQERRSRARNRTNVGQSAGTRFSNRAPVFRPASRAQAAKRPSLTRKKRGDQERGDRHRGRRPRNSHKREDQERRSSDRHRGRRPRNAHR